MRYSIVQRLGFWATVAVFCAGFGGMTGCRDDAWRVERHGDEIIVAGQMFRIGTPVVLWIDPGGYDAYRARCHFDPDEYFPSQPVAPGNPNRYNTRHPVSDALEEKVDREGWTLANLQEQVDLFVYHYDACGTSARCFKVLQDIRGLSVHFMLDLDGTIYQTLDLKERAWHAGDVNSRCVGIEIANIGAYPEDELSVLEEWYTVDEDGWPRVTFPPSVTETQQRTPDFVARPARKEMFRGRVNGRTLYQYDFTNEQYEALIKLTAAMHRIFPRVKLQIPRLDDGSVRMDVLPPEALEAFSGFLGHQHTIKVKPDPGPAFDWERVLRGARRELR